MHSKCWIKNLMKKLFIPEWKSFIYVLMNTDTSISQISKLNSYEILIFVTVNIFYRLPFWKKYGKYFALCLQICQVLVWTASSYIMLIWRSCSMARYYQFSCRIWKWNESRRISESKQNLLQMKITSLPSC